MTSPYDTIKNGWPTVHPSAQSPYAILSEAAVIEANLGQENSTTNVREYFDEVGNRSRLEIIMHTHQ